MGNLSLVDYAHLRMALLRIASRIEDRRADFTDKLSAQKALDIVIEAIKQEAKVHG